MQTTLLFTLTAHRQMRWTPGWITTNRIVFPRVGTSCGLLSSVFPSSVSFPNRGGGQSPQGLVGPFYRYPSAATPVFPITHNP